MKELYKVEMTERQNIIFHQYVYIRSGGDGEVYNGAELTKWDEIYKHIVVTEESNGYALWTGISPFREHNRTHTDLKAFCENQSREDVLEEAIILVRRARTKGRAFLKKNSDPDE